MDSLILAGLLFAFLLVLLATGLWVGIALILVGFCAIAFFSPAPAGSLLASTVWDNSWNWALTALPLFIWMGEILFRSRLSEDMFKGLAPWLTWLPGRLLHVNIVGCGVMAAVAGSSAVTCATVGKISMPELQRRGYDESMAIGTLAGSGTLGLLIPPSIMLIVYGVVAQQSIARMFIAGILPGLLLVGLFMGYVMLWSCLRPSRVPASDITMSFGAMVWGLRRLFPVVALIALVLGSIYGGYATPTEAATLGVLGALALAFGAGALTWRTFHDSLLGAVKTSCMITLIIAGASFLAVAMGFTGIPRAIADGVASLGLSPAMLLVVLTVLYVILGCFLDGVSLIVLTASVVMPMILDAGIDPIWFGIYLVIVVEMSQITPPVGFNLFVLQAITGRDIWRVTKASTPFFLVMLFSIAIIAYFPAIVTYLPEQMMRR